MTPETTLTEQLYKVGRTLGFFVERVDNNSSLPSGRTYERRFQAAVELLVTEGIVKGFEKTKPNSADDAKGIDYHLLLAEGIVVPFQVTSTLKHARTRKKNHPNIPVIFGRIGRSLFGKEYLARKILELAGEYLLESAFREMQSRSQQLTWRKLGPASPEETIYDVICERRSTRVHLIGSDVNPRRILKDNPKAIIVKPRNKRGWKSIPQIEAGVESALGLR